MSIRRRGGWPRGAAHRHRLTGRALGPPLLPTVPLRSCSSTAIPSITPCHTVHDSADRCVVVVWSANLGVVGRGGVAATWSSARCDKGLRNKMTEKVENRSRKIAKNLKLVQHIFKWYLMMILQMIVANPYFAKQSLPFCEVSLLPMFFAFST